MSKFALIGSAVVWLAVLGVINSMISAFYYLRVVYVMYMRPLPKREPSFVPSISITAVATLAALGALALGLWPTAVLAAAQTAILGLVR